MARLMKDSGVEWIGEIPENWEIRKLKNVSEINSGEYVSKESYESEGRFDIIGSNGKIGTINRTNVCKRVIITGRVGSIGTAYIVENVWVTDNALIIKNNKDILVDYLVYIIPLFPYETILMGTAQPLITATTLKKQFILYPNLCEQRKIADFLDEKVADIDSVIAKTKETIEDYKRYRQAIITDAVTKGLHSDVEMKDTDSEWIGEIPKQWKVTKVKVVSEKVTDGAHVSPETDNGIYDFVSTVNLGKHGIEFENCLKTSEASYQQLVKNGCKPKINDVLISKDGTVGKTVVIDFDREFVVASSLVIIRPNMKLINPYYLDYNLQAKFVQEQLVMLMHGAGLKRVSVEKNANLPVLLPTLKEQQMIVNYLDEKCSEIDKLIEKKEELLADLESYKKSLIYEYVTGKKEVE